MVRTTFIRTIFNVKHPSSNFIRFFISASYSEHKNNISSGKNNIETFPYVVADLKTMDRGETEVEIAVMVEQAQLLP